MITVRDSEPPSLEEAQGIVGGFVEMVTLPDGTQMLVDEDGLSKDLPPNLEATILADRKIVGQALLLRGKARWM